MFNGCYKRSAQQKGYKAAYPADGAHYLNALLNKNSIVPNLLKLDHPLSIYGGSKF